MHRAVKCKITGEGSETVSQVWREEKMRLENELKKMEEIKLNLEIEIQDLRKDVPVETKVIFLSVILGASDHSGCFQSLGYFLFIFTLYNVDC